MICQVSLYLVKMRLNMRSKDVFGICIYELAPI